VSDSPDPTQHYPTALICTPLNTPVLHFSRPSFPSLVLIFANLYTPFVSVNRFVMLHTYIRYFYQYVIFTNILYLRSAHLHCYVALVGGGGQMAKFCTFVACNSLFVDLFL